MTAPALTLYTVAEAADILGMGRSTLYRAIKANKVPHRLLPGTDMVRLTPEDLQQYIAAALQPAA